MTKTPHTTFAKGKRVFVILRSGDSFIDKYVGKKGRFVYLEEAGEIEVRTIRSMSFNRSKK